MSASPTYNTGGATHRLLYWQQGGGSRQDEQVPCGAWNRNSGVFGLLCLVKRKSPRFLRGGPYSLLIGTLARGIIAVARFGRAQSCRASWANWNMGFASGARFCVLCCLQCWAGPWWEWACWTGVGA
jgi:hypothetical protein